MSMHRSSAALLFCAPLALGSACHHPCQADPAQCPYPTLQVRTTPQVSHPGLIQRQAPDSQLTLKVTGENGERPGEIAVYFCAAGSECREGCEGFFKPELRPGPASDPDATSQSYTIEGSALGRLPLGPARLCAAGHVTAFQEMYVINRLLRTGTPKQLTFQMSPDLAPVSFEIARDQSGLLKVLILGETKAWRSVYAFAYSAESTASPVAGLSGPQTNGSLRMALAGSDLFVLWGTKSSASIGPPYWAARCPLTATNITCTSLMDLQWMLPTLTDLNAATGDTLGKRFFVSSLSGSTSLHAFSTALMKDKSTEELWAAQGPAGPTVLIAGPVFSRELSDVIAVAKGASASNTRAVRMFRATRGPGLASEPVASNSLQSAIDAALGTQPLTAAASGDLDGDGLAELVLLSAPQNKLHILFNQGNGSFRIAGSSLTNPPSVQDPEASLGSLPILADSLDLKIVNVDDPKDLSQERPELVLLSKTQTVGEAKLQILRLE